MRAFNTTPPGKILLFLSIFFFATSCICRLIYGGVYWGKLNKSSPKWNDDRSPNPLKTIQKRALLQWVFCLCVPFGSFVTTSILLDDTKPSKCESYKILLTNTSQTNIEYFTELTNFLNLTYPSKEFNEQLDDYMNTRCTTPHILFWVFLGFMLFSNTLTIIYFMCICFC